MAKRRAKTRRSLGSSSRRHVREAADVFNLAAGTLSTAEDLAARRDCGAALATFRDGAMRAGEGFAHMASASSGRGELTGAGETVLSLTARAMDALRARCFVKRRG